MNEVELKLVLCEELVRGGERIGILPKIVNYVIQYFSVMLMGIPFAVVGDCGNDHVLDGLMKVGVLHGPVFGPLDMGFVGGDHSWCGSGFHLVHKDIISHSTDM